jgi:roadblock/LC7 domain-containing protein
MAIRLAISAALASVLLAAGCATGTAADLASAQRFADREGVERALERYILAMDRLQPEAYADAFAPDGEIVIYGEDVHHGRAELVAYMRGVKDNQEAADARGELQQFFHMHYNQRIEVVDADTAFHTAFWTTTARLPDGSVVDLAVGTLKDEFVKRDGEWLLFRRELFADP